MNDNSTYQAVRIGDIADWRLICVISAKGMCAYLKHSDPTREVVTLFEEKWNEDSGLLLSRIEETVYDHPQVLDDFSADIAIVASDTLVIPVQLVGDDEDDAKELYRSIYSVEEDDVMLEYVDGEVMAYSLVPGLSSFLMRTFPGASIHSHLGVLTKRFRERSSDMPRVYVNIRSGKCDILAFDCRNLLLASTHEWHDVDDIQYHVFNVMNVYGLNPEETQVSLSGLKDVKTSLMQALRKNINYVMLTMIPSLGARAGMPVVASLMMRS